MQPTGHPTRIATVTGQLQPHSAERSIAEVRSRRYQSDATYWKESNLQPWREGGSTIPRSDRCSGQHVLIVLNHMFFSHSRKSLPTTSSPSKDDLFNVLSMSKHQTFVTAIRTMSTSTISFRNKSSIRFHRFRVTFFPQSRARLIIVHQPQQVSQISYSVHCHFDSP